MGTRRRIGRVHAVEHTAPVPAGDSLPKRRRSWEWTFRVRLHAPAAGSPEDSSRELIGSGEAHTPARVPPAGLGEGPPGVLLLCRGLIGTEFPLAEDPSDIIAGLVPQEAHPTVGAALESALGDLLSQAQGRAPAEMAQPYEDLLPYVRRHLWFPTPPPLRDAEGRAANTYDLDIFQGLPKVGEANQELQKTALARGLRTLRTSWKDFTARDSAGRRMVFGMSFSEDSSPVSGVVTGNKQLTRQFLESAGAAVPPGRTFRVGDEGAALRYAEELGYPVVAKPLAGKSGLGVVAGIEGADGLRWALRHIGELQDARGRMIVEKHIPGQDYRIYVAYGKVLSVVVRRPASVMGDGRRSVAELVLAANHQRRQNPHTRTRLIRLDDAAFHQLEKQGLDWGSTPAEGRPVRLAGAANISRGGDSTEVLPEAHPSILQAAVRAVEAIPGLNQAGVDFLLPDHRLSLDEQPGGICEINTTPALMANQAPVFGEVQPVAQELIRLTAESTGVKVSRSQDSLRLAVRAQGLADPAAVADWLTAQAHRLELSGRIRTVGPTHVRLLLAGPTERVAALLSSLHSGRLDQRPDWVKTMPYRGKMPRRFHPARREEAQA